DLHPATALGERLGADGPLHRRAQRGDDRERLAVAQAPEREQPLMHRGRRWRPGLVRERLALGERDDAILPEPAAELGAPATGAILARRDDEHGAALRRDERRPRVRARAG